MMDKFKIKLGEIILKIIEGSNYKTIKMRDELLEHYRNDKRVKKEIGDRLKARKTPIHRKYTDLLEKYGLYEK